MSARVCSADGGPCRAWATCGEHGCVREWDARNAEEGARLFAQAVRDVTPHETLPSGVKFRDFRKAAS